VKRTYLRAILVSVVWAGFHLAAPGVGRAGNWPGWRGPTGVGYTGEKNLPLTWDGKTGKNVLWKASLAGTTGHSSPIVWGDRVFITTAAKQTREQEERKEVPEHHLACYRAADGKLFWRTRIPQGKQPAGYAIYAVPTPVTDGKVVYAWFGSAVIAAIDFDGKLLWRHERPGPFGLNPGICSSPTLYEDTVILICDQSRGKGFLQGLDKKTGEVRWEQKRTKVTYCNTTPLLLEVKGKPQLIVAGSSILEGLNPANGEPVWWCRSAAFGASPAYGSGLIYIDKGGNEPAGCVDPAGQGDVAKTHVRWQIPKSAGGYASPVIAGGYVYKVRREGVVACLALSTGEEVYTAKLKGLSKLASPIATADGRIYFVSTGRSYVIKVGPRLEVLGSGNLGGWGNGSSAAVSGGRIFVRDFRFLYCIGRK